MPTIWWISAALKKVSHTFWNLNYFLTPFFPVVNSSSNFTKLPSMWRYLWINPKWSFIIVLIMLKINEQFFISLLKSQSKCKTKSKIWSMKWVYNLTFRMTKRKFIKCKAPANNETNVCSDFCKRSNEQNFLTPWNAYVHRFYDKRNSNTHSQIRP